MKIRSVRTSLAAVCLALSAIAASALDEQARAKTQESYWKQHFSLHGFLTVAYADLEREGREPTGDETILGIPDDGTFEYGIAALNLRYDPAPRHALILQLAHRELGESPVEEVEDDVELDWLFYELKLSPQTRLRLGRQPVAAGIFNELRDVGVLLPFYRPAFSFYREGSLFSETVDGVAISHTFSPDALWNLVGDVYYGEFELLEQGVDFGQGVTEVEASNALGFQLWLETPVDGLRFGIGGERWDVGEESAFNFEEKTWKSWYASVDGSFERFVARGEYRRLDADFASTPATPLARVGVDFYYLQLGWLATDKLGLYAQPEITDITQQSVVFVDGVTRSRDRRDLGFSAVWTFRPNIVLKAEYHDVEFEANVGQDFVPVPGGALVRNRYKTFEGDYSILSLSLSF